MNTHELERIREELRKRKITQKYLAFLFGVSPGWIGECLRGNYPFNHAADVGRAVFPNYLRDYCVDRGIIKHHLTPNNE